MAGRRVEVLRFEGRAHGQAAHALVDRVLADLDAEPDVASIQVDDVDAAKRLRFLGSPTIRVDGRDVEPGADARTQYRVACRWYPTPGGLSSLPDEDWVRAALHVQPDEPG